MLKILQLIPDAFFDENSAGMLSDNGLFVLNNAELASN
jgi:hypothetical protein